MILHPSGSSLEHVVGLIEQVLDVLEAVGAELAYFLCVIAITDLFESLRARDITDFLQELVEFFQAVFSGDVHFVLYDSTLGFDYLVRKHLDRLQHKLEPDSDVNLAGEP